LGAFIGYMTNYVAIRMLFRPLKPWKLLGIRLPLTPGVIPAKRHELAQNIGEMVGGHLLTSTDVSRALTDDRFQQELRNLIEGRVENILHRDLGPVASLIPARFRSYFEVSIKVLRLRFLEHLHAFLDGDAISDNLRQTLAGSLNGLLRAPLAQYLTTDKQERLYTLVEETTANFLNSPAVQEWIAERINKGLDEFIARGGCLADLLPTDLREALLVKLEEQTPDLLAKAAKLLEDPQVQLKIATVLSNAAGNFISTMGPMAALIGNFINPAKIERKVQDYLAANSSSISQWLFEPAVQQKVSNLIREKAELFLSTPVAEWLHDIDAEKIQNARQWLIARLVASLRNQEVARTIAGLLKNGLEGQYKRTMEEILADLFGPQVLAEGVEWLSGEAVSILRSSQVKRMLDGLITDLVDKRIMQQPVGTLAAFLPKEVQEGIADYLRQQVSDILVREVPGVVDSLNIKEIVARKVDSLDLLRLEGLLLGIMQEQFKYINLFGGLLGFIIGLANLIFLSGLP